MKPIDVIIPSRGTTTLVPAIESLRYLPFPINLHLIVGKPFPEAVNEGFAQSTGDVLLMDDDVRLLPETFTGFRDRLATADVFGFWLTFPDGRVQHGGGFCRNGSVGHIGYGVLLMGSPLSYEVCHATSALVYYKRHVYATVGDYDVSYTPSASLSDVDYSFRVLKAGFHIRMMPNTAIHDESPKTDPEVQVQMQHNLEKLRAAHLQDEDFVRLVERFPKGATL